MEKVMEIWKQALAIWLPEYPDIQISQGLHRLPTNTTYWTNWPTAENNYFHPPIWWQTTLQIIMNLKPAQ